MRSSFQNANRRVGVAAHSLSPIQLRSIVAAARTRFDSLNKSRDQAISARVESGKQQLGMAAAALDAMSPLRVLERGYAIAQDVRGRAIREANTMAIGDELRVRLWKGALDCRVEGKTEE